MVFSDLIFIYVFLPLCMGLYFFGKNKTYRNIVLILFSLVFYAWGEPVWVILLIISAIVDYTASRFIEKNYGKPIAKLGVIMSLVINLGLLGTFKYSGFIVENINALTGLSLNVPSFALPIGISFYTFQTISYTIDVYRGQVKAQHSFIKFLMYVSLFFQLVAGPIVRYSTVAAEIENRQTSLADFSNGISRFIIGLGKKVIIANTVGELAGKFLDLDNPTSAFGAWFGVIMYALQIYYDFSGYSDMAIGLGRMVGFHFEENFIYPYVSKSATEFWRRWHISLGSFFRDYVYIPMGGNRRHQYLNLFVVWFLTGLWHGASWNFIIWGLYFGFFVIIEKLFLGKVLERIPSIFSHIYLLFVAIISWEIFYFTDMGQLTKYLKAMFGIGVQGIDEISKTAFFNNVFIIAIAMIFALPMTQLIKRLCEKLSAKSGAFEVLVGTGQIVFSVAVLFISTTLLVGQAYNPFLYFRF